MQCSAIVKILVRCAERNQTTGGVKPTLQADDSPHEASPHGLEGYKLMYNLRRLQLMPNTGI
jgi:hypothetical protein